MPLRKKELEKIKKWMFDYHFQHAFVKEAFMHLIDLLRNNYTEEDEEQ